MKLTVTRKSHTRREKNGPVTYVAGQSFDGTAGELKAFGDRLEAASAKQEPKGEGKKAEKPAKQEPKGEGKKAEKPAKQEPKAEADGK